MGVVQRRINGRALYEAMKINGVGHVRGEWFHFDGNNNPTAGCALGLMAINLGVAAHSSKNYGANLRDQLNQIEVPEDSPWRKANEYDDLFPPPQLGESIIFWNDASKQVPTGKFYPLTESDVMYGYEPEEIMDNKFYLETWEEVHQMVFELLEPHFATEFTVDEWVFGEGN